MAQTGRPPSLLVVAPHPDDESIATGGTLLYYAKQGVATHVITCTGGEAGDNLAGIDLDGRPLPAHRRSEMAAAATALELTSHAWLGFRDSGMAGTEANTHPDAFVNVDLDTAAARLATHLRLLRPEVVISDDSLGSYGHPDHIRAHDVTVAAIPLASNPDAEVEGEPHVVRLHAAHAVSRDHVFSMHQQLRARGLLSPFGEVEEPDFGVAPESIAISIDVADQLEGKRAAMLAHRSQVSLDSAFFNMPDDLVTAMWSLESYAIVSTARELTDDDRQAMADDLFAGWVS